MSRIMLTLTLAIALGVTACTPSPQREDTAAAADPAPTSQPTEAAAAEPTEEPTEAVDPAEIGANELGEIPVLMYHRVFDGAVGEYDITPDELRQELQYLYDHGYRPVRVDDIVRGAIDVPAGMTPFAMTFDDSSAEQMAYTDDGEIAPDTAVGILLEFAERHPDFEPVASFYVNAGPFGGGADGPDLLRELHELGFELGNHTAGHANLRTLPDERVQAELAAGVEVITDAVPEAEVTTLSLPLGLWPDPRELAYAGPGYRHDGILLVGSHPALSPFHVEFDPLAIPRIRSTPSWDGGDPDFSSGWWFTILEEQPQRRYISDGDPDTISFPADLADDLAPAFSDRAIPYEG